MVVVVGEVGDGLLAGLGRFPHVSVARAPAAGAGQPVPVKPAAVLPSWEEGALAMQEAARRRSTYAVVRDDPLADLAVEWRAMWEVPGGSRGASGFEERAADTLRSLEHGPWWPPLDEVIDAARRCYAGGLAETQLAPS